MDQRRYPPISTLPGAATGQVGTALRRAAGGRARTWEPPAHEHWTPAAPVTSAHGQSASVPRAVVKAPPQASVYKARPSHRGITEHMSLLQGTRLAFKTKKVAVNIQETRSSSLNSPASCLLWPRLPGKHPRARAGPKMAPSPMPRCRLPRSPSARGRGCGCSHLRRRPPRNASGPAERPRPPGTHLNRSRSHEAAPPGWGEKKN